MKKILLSLITLAVVGLTAKVEAQCTVSTVGFEIKDKHDSTLNSVLGCSVTFNFNFTINNNNGNKIVVIQAWLAGDYPDYWQCNVANHTSSVQKAPKAADLRKTTSPYTAGSPGPLPFLNLAFLNDVTPPIPITAYGPDGSVSMNTGYTVTRSAPINAANDVVITITGVTVFIPAPCGTGVSVLADLWSSQSNVTSQWTPHCVNCHNLFAFNYPQVDAAIQCTVPRTYSTTVTNINTTQTITFTWKAYLDKFPFGGSRGIEDVLADDEAVTAPTGPITLAPGAHHTEIRPYTYANNAEGNLNLWVEVSTVGLPNTQTAYALQASGCIGLPVKFKSFAAARNHSTVKATWVTSTEINNSGFALERLIGGSGWQQIAFIPSQAQGGNSSSDLTYTYNDLNNTNGISQYRVRQVDFDNKSSYSDIRAVRGEGQAGKTIVFPNPSNDGKVNVVFEDGNATRDISVMDMSGRLVKQMKGVTNNTIQIDNLTPGMYSLRVVVRETGDQVVEKVVINKR